MAARNRTKLGPREGPANGITRLPPRLVFGAAERTASAKLKWPFCWPPSLWFHFIRLPPPLFLSVFWNLFCPWGRPCRAPNTMDFFLAISLRWRPLPSGDRAAS